MRYIIEVYDRKKTYYFYPYKKIHCVEMIANYLSMVLERE